MAAYASVVSLMTLIDQIQNHPYPPITLHKHHVESLWQNATFLQEFLEAYPHRVIVEADDGLESRIADVDYAAADVIESHIADRIRGGSSKMTGIEQVILDMDSVVKEAMEIRDRIGNPNHQLQRHLFPHSSRKTPLVGVKNAMVGFDDVFNQVLDKLTGDQSSRQIIPIVGMGGIGKTTLATNAFGNQLVLQHFDIHSWVTISQDYKAHEVLLKILLDQNKDENRDKLSRLSEGELGQKVYHKLYDRRYLVVMDDMWSVKVWNEINRFFPDNNNRSRIIITTRLSFVASELSSEMIVINFLDDQKSWNLLCNIVFGEEACPIELEESGRNIAKCCKGLPLSISVMGGLLTKFKQTQKDWALIAKKLNSNVNLEHEERCLHILHTSFEYMPIHLKPCFLYLSVFPQDKEINASNLIKLWVAEGFVKPIFGKSLELAAKEYLIDLVDRNLILMKERGSIEKIKVCGVHDLMRDLSIKEAEKERFICDARKHSLSNHQDTEVRPNVLDLDNIATIEHLHQVIEVVQKSSLIHSVISETHVYTTPPKIPSEASYVDIAFQTAPLRVSRILSCISRGGLPYLRELRKWLFECIVGSVNSRFIACNGILWSNSNIGPSICLLWNLQTLIIPNNGDYFPLEIWKMHQLRHIKVSRLCLSNPPQDMQDSGFVLQNLQTLSCIENFTFGEEVVKRIPNVTKLKTIYHDDVFGGLSQYYFNYLNRLQKLKSLSYAFNRAQKFRRNDLLQNLTFPNCLIKLE